MIPQQRQIIENPHEVRRLEGVGRRGIVLEVHLQQGESTVPRQSSHQPGFAHLPRTTQDQDN